ncbi:ABC transporter ATP-binding protein [Rhodovibrionaceae bacterium A322]
MSASPNSLPQPDLTLDKARLIYGNQVLFEDLSLTLSTGQTCCLLGPSGVGKSSLLHLISGLLNDAEGEVRFHGRPLEKGQLAYMAQKDLLLPWLSVLDNCLLGPRLRATAKGDMTALKDKAALLLNRLGLGEVLQALPKQLSGGMRQRVALARTLMEDRPLVLMDEPFSALDAITRMDLQDLAAETLADKTVLLVTHDPLEALRLGHRILILQGRPAHLLEIDAPKGLPARDPSAPDLLQQQAELFRQLHQARHLSDPTGNGQQKQTEASAEQLQGSAR